VADYVLSDAARQDLLRIAEYTLDRFGARRSETYLEEFRRCFDLISRNPGIGRNMDRIRPGLRRYDRGSHLVFYMSGATGLLVVRVLHARQDPHRHIGAD
tara:strand:- start:208 stop:507 length:300 start_codon:yes stop_codon:yes gene_type:complete